MRIIKTEQNEEAREVNVTIGHVGNDVVSVTDKGPGEFLVLYETGDGMPSERVIFGLRKLADEMESARAEDVATQPGARA